jgi:hypothetical protein
MGSRAPRELNNLVGTQSSASATVHYGLDSVDSHAEHLAEVIRVHRTLEGQRVNKVCNFSGTRFVNLDEQLGCPRASDTYGVDGADIEALQSSNLLGGKLPCDGDLLKGVVHRFHFNRCLVGQQRRSLPD